MKSPVSVLLPGSYQRLAAPLKPRISPGLAATKALGGPSKSRCYQVSFKGVKGRGVKFLILGVSEN